MDDVKTSILAQNSQKISQFLYSAWNGKIKLWQALVIVNLLGFLIAESISMAGGAILISITGVKIFSIAYMLIVNVIYGVFAVICLWRNAPPAQNSIKGALTRMWAIAFAFYLTWVHYQFIFS